MTKETHAIKLRRLLRYTTLETFYNLDTSQRKAKVRLLNELMGIMERLDELDESNQRFKFNQSVFEDLSPSTTKKFHQLHDRD